MKNYDILEEKQIYKFEQIYLIDKENKIYDNLWIDVKFGIFKFGALGENNVNSNFNIVLGYKYFYLDYEVKGDEIFVFYGRRLSEERIKIFVSRICDNNKLDEIVAVLQRMKDGYYIDKFQYEFDDSFSVWEQTDNERLTFESFFQDELSDLEFSAKYIQYNNFDGFINDEYAEILMGIRHNGNYTTYNELMLSDNNENELIFEIRLKNSNIEITMKLKNLEDIYINIKSASVFIGSQYEYTQFMFGSENEAQNLFNILAILETTNDYHNMLDIPWIFEP